VLRENKLDERGLHFTHVGVGVGIGVDGHDDDESIRASVVSLDPPDLAERVSKSMVKIDKEYVCKRCGRAYRSRSNAAYHVETNHMKLSLRCKFLCERTFTNRESRDKHQRKKCHLAYVDYDDY